jgi:tetratricopeptide (TPR) repeat protein
MQKTRHQIFQQIASALAHQQSGKTELALAYWENVLRLLPVELRIHNEILAECARMATGNDLERIQQKVELLTQTYHQEFVDEEQLLFQYVYQAMIQQCSRNDTLAFAYWERIVPRLASDALILTLGVQDFCWSAHQYLKAGNIKKCLEIYDQLVRTFPDFLEGYINLSIIKSKYGSPHEALPILKKLPLRSQEEFIIVKYRELYTRIAEITEQFDHVPYAAIEDIVNDLRIENTFYPSIAEEYFTEFISELVNREKRFFEKQRKALEEKAIAKTSARLAQEGIALGQRVTLAKQAKSEEIADFLYDNDVHVVEALLNNPNMTREDVLIMAQTSAVSDILTLIVDNRKWGTVHGIVMAILLNPQTLPRDSARLLDLVSINDLAKVFYKKTLPTEVRMRAKRKVQQIFHELSLADQVAVVEATAGDIFKFLDDRRVELPSFLDALVKKFADQPEIIVNISRWKLTPVPILTLIGTNLRLTSNIQIKFALLSNPRAPEHVVRALVQSLAEKDAEYMLLNKYLPASVKHAIVTFFPKVST